MKLHELPSRVKDDIERKSLKLAQQVGKRIMIIGGWAVRAHGGKSHARYTFDIDGVADKKGLKRARQLLKEMDFSLIDEEWGFRAEVPYKAPEEFQGDVEGLKIKVEVSEPRIYDMDGVHYFEFDLEENELKRVISIDEITQVDLRVPKIDYLVANKLGLPPLFKNMYDGCVLLLQSDVGKVSDLIKKTDDWSELVRPRISMILERLHNRSTLLHRELSKDKQVSEIRQKIEQILNKLP